jgi:hypothetical protein
MPKNNPEKNFATLKKQKTNLHFEILTLKTPKTLKTVNINP